MALDWVAGGEGMLMPGTVKECVQPSEALTIGAIKKSARHHIDQRLSLWLDL